MPSLNIDDPREAFLELISLENSRVNLNPPLIYIFGGSLVEPTSTLRSKLVKAGLCCNPPLREVIIIEDFHDWMEYGTYSDLLTFELELLQTSSLVVIILESEGSIAELGAFVNDDFIKERILVVITEDHYAQSSFIKLGLLKHLEDIDDEKILKYPSFNDGDEISNEIIEECKKFIENADNQESFNKNNIGHVAFLVYELILIYDSLTITEIINYLKLLGFEAVDKKTAKRFIFLLLKLDLIKGRTYGAQTFYAVDNPRVNRFVFASKKAGKRFDKLEVINSSISFYNTNKRQKNRIKAKKKSP